MICNSSFSTNSKEVNSRVIVPIYEPNTLTLLFTDKR